LVMKPLNQRVIGCYQRYGPFFGDGADIIIKSHSNQNYKSFSNLGKCFKHPEYSHESDEAKSFLAGYFSFKTVEIEVFTENL